MKKLFLMAVALFACTSLCAQMKIGAEVNYYGIDFSRAKSYGAYEAGEQFVQAFQQINDLVIAEWEKFKLEKYLRNKVLVRDISVTQAINRQIDSTQIAAPRDTEQVTSYRTGRKMGMWGWTAETKPVVSSGYAISDGQIAEMVKAYRIEEPNGTGLVILGELLNKQFHSGTYLVVYFDIASRKVLYIKDITGEAGGAGLAAYWAGALRDALKHW